MVQRQVRKRHPYNTRSNKVKKVRTPGGNLVFHKVLKRGTIPKCSVCKKTLRGIKMARPAAFKRMKKKCRTVSRPFGGNTCGECVKDKITNAFMDEELKRAQLHTEKISEKAQ